jgi:hypothetical protein
MSTRKQVLFLITGIIYFIIGFTSIFAKADTVFSTTAPTAIKVSEITAQKLAEFYKCSLIKRGPNYNPVKAGDTIFATKAPENDSTALDKLDDPKNKVYRCELVEVNSSNGRLRKVKS